MVSLKEFAIVCSLGASTVLSGCASSSPTGYQGTGALYDPPTNAAQSQQQQQRVPEGMLVRRDFNGVSLEFCDAKDQFMRTSKGVEYCFDKNDVKYALNKNLIPGERIQYQGPQYGQQVMNQFMRTVNRGIEARSSNNSTIQFGRNGKGGINMVDAFMSTNEYKRSCFTSFAFLDENMQINGNLRKSPAQLGTYDNCVKELRTQTTIRRAGPITINF
jgi:hypothetical protein